MLCGATGAQPVERGAITPGLITPGDFPSLAAVITPLEILRIMSDSTDKNLEKVYAPSEIEEKWAERWLKEGLYDAGLSKTGRAFPWSSRRRTLPARFTSDTP